MAGLLWLLVAGLTAGCETPQAPRFQTNLYIPIGVERADGEDFFRDYPEISGDSSGTTPLVYSVNGTLERVSAGEFLELSLGGTEFSASLDTIAFDPPGDIVVSFGLSDLTDIPIPAEGIFAVVPPFTFPVVERRTPPRDEFDWLAILEGRASVQITNRLTIPVGSDGTGPSAFGLRLLNYDQGSTAVDVELVREIGPGETGFWGLDLDGVRLTDRIAVEVRGGSAGGGGDPVWIEPSQGVDIRVVFELVRPDSIIAPVDDQSVVLTGGIPLSEDLRVSRGKILQGALPVEIRNDIPLDASARLTFPQLSRMGSSLGLVVSVPAGSAEGPGLAETSLDLSEADMEAGGEEPADSLRYELLLLTAGSSGDPRAIGRRQRAVARLGETTVALDWVEGIAEGRRIDLPVTETAVDVPDELDEVEFIEADLVVGVENAVGLGGTAALVIEALAKGGIPVASLLLEIELPAGSPEAPASARALLNEDNSDVLELIRVRPERLRISGSVLAGSEGRVVRVAASEWIEGSYSLETPLRAAVTRLEHRIDPTSFSVSRDEQRRILEDLGGAEVVGEIENHLPVAVSATVSFATRAADLEAEPDLVLESVHAAAGVIDPLTGRAAEASRTAFTVGISAQDVDFFARDEVWADVLIVAEGDGVTPVEITALDYVEVRGHIRLEFDVAP